MRGRTNAEPNIGVQLNATTDTYEVAPNETVLAGDFVERYEYSSNKLAGATSVATSDSTLADISPKLFRLSDGNYLCTTENATNLYHIDSNEEITKIWDEKETPNISSDFIIQLDDDNLLGEFTGYSGNSGTAPILLCSVMGYNASGHTVFKKTIESNKFTGVTNLNTTRAIWFYKISERNYRVFIYKTQSDSASSSSHVLYTFLLNITGNNYDNYALECSDLIYTAGDGGLISFYDSLFLVKKIGTNFYVRSDDTHFIKFDGTKFDSDKLNFSKISRITSNDSYLSNFVINRDDDSAYIYYFTNDILTSSGKTKQTLYINKMYLDVDNQDCNVFTHQVIFSSPNIDSFPNRCNIRRLYEDSTYYYFILFAYYDDNATINLIRVNKTSGEHESFPMTRIDGEVKYNNIFMISKIHNNDVWVVNYFNSSKGRVLSVVRLSSNIFVDKSSTYKQVRGITTQDYIMGVAKQSGTAGDTIEVYIPQVNS